jgi:hypothetical protein
MSIKISITTEGEEQLSIALDKLSHAGEDLTPVWGAVKKTFQDIEADQFQSSGALGASGKWKPLSKAYEKEKIQRLGTFALLAGINIASERLYKSLKGDTGDTVFVQAKDSLTLGTTVPYAKYVQDARPVISLSGKQIESLSETIKKGLIEKIGETGFVMDENNFRSFG